jgi:hypothetical protein
MLKNGQPLGMLIQRSKHKQQQIRFVEIKRYIKSLGHVD